MPPFDPYVYAPRSTYGQPIAGPMGPMDHPVAVAIPRAQEIDLSIIAGAVTPDPDTIYTADYFMFHPVDETFQNMWVSSDFNSAVEYLSLHLIQKTGQQVVTLQNVLQFRQLTIDPVRIDDCGPWGSGPVFLRVATKGVLDASMYVTVNTMTSEVF